MAWATTFLIHKSLPSSLKLTPRDSTNMYVITLPLPNEAMFLLFWFVGLVTRLLKSCVTIFMNLGGCVRLGTEMNQLDFGIWIQDQFYHFSGTERSGVYRHFLFFFHNMLLRPIIGQPGNSSIISRVKPRQTSVQLGKRAGFDDVGHRFWVSSQGHRSVSVRRQVFLQAPQCP